MNPIPWISVFGGISVVALSFQLVDDFWLPMLLGALATALIARLVR